MKTILSILFAAFLCFTTNAQTNFYSALGINVSSIKINKDQAGIAFPEGAYGSLVNISANFGLAIPISSKLFFQSELAYSPKGYTVNQITSPEKLEIKVKSNYIDIMPAIAYQINPIRLELGAFIGFSLSDKIKVNDQFWSDDLDLTNNPNYGMFAGINLILIENISLFGRYYTGFNNISTITYTDMDGNPAGVVKEKTQHIQIGLSSKF